VLVRGEETRIEAHHWFTLWNEDLDRLEAKRDQAEKDAEVLRAAWVKARDEGLNAIMGKAVLVAAIANPLAHTMGQSTGSYAQFRRPQLWRVLAEGDESHPEWDQAVAHLKSLAVRAGFELTATTGSAEAKRMWENYAQEHITPAQEPAITQENEILARVSEASRVQRALDRTITEDLRQVPRRAYMDAGRGARAAPQAEYVSLLRRLL